MPLQRSFLRQMMLSLFDKEATYNSGPTSWTTGVCSMLDFDDASALEVWDDTFQNNTDVISGKEFITISEMPRQSMRVQYTEPRVKPNTLAGLLALTLGNVVSTQDGALEAYRHFITPGSAVQLPSIGVQTKRDNGAQFKYTGVKADSFTMNENGPYWSGQCALIGSGTRDNATDAFPAPIMEHWMRWGDAHIYFRDTARVPMTIPPAPSQSTCNLGAGFVDFSTRVLTWSLTWNNNLQPDMGYRASTGKIRTDFHCSRRAATIAIKFETDTLTEATELGYYLSEADLSMELTINTGELIAPTGLFVYGATLVVPRLRLTQIPRSQTNEVENLEMQGELLDDMTNPPMVAWVYNSTPAYLA